MTEDEREEYEAELRDAPIVRRQMEEITALQTMLHTEYVNMSASSIIRRLLDMDGMPRNYLIAFPDFMVSSADFSHRTVMYALLSIMHIARGTVEWIDGFLVMEEM